MPRFQDTLTGVVVDVSEAEAVDLGERYEPVDKPRKAPAGKK